MTVPKRVKDLSEFDIFFLSCQAHHKFTSDSTSTSNFNEAICVPSSASPFNTITFFYASFEYIKKFNVIFLLFSLNHKLINATMKSDVAN